MTVLLSPVSLVTVLGATLSELPPARWLTPPEALRGLRQLESSAELRRLLGDVTHCRYGQKAHLESSLEALKLWDNDNPPQLESVEELNRDGYGLRLHFALSAVAFDRWEERRERLGRFFGSGLRAKLHPCVAAHLDLDLVPAAADYSSAPAP